MKTFVRDGPVSRGGRRGRPRTRRNRIRGGVDDSDDEDAAVVNMDVAAAKPVSNAYAFVKRRSPRRLQTDPPFDRKK